MENNYYHNPIVNQTDTNEKEYVNIPNINTSKYLGELSYFENLIKLNIGKLAKLYVTIPGSNEYKDRVFMGVIEESGHDYIIVSNPTNGEWYLIFMVYLNYITFDEAITFKY